MSADNQVVDILRKLSEDDLYNLAKTVTQGLKRSSSETEAIQNIIKYSPDVLSILRRKIVTREILFSYLDERNIKVRLPTTKNELIDEIVALWHMPRISSIQNNSASSETHSTEVEIVTKNTNIEHNQTKDNSVNLLAEQFSQWFYSMLNETGTIDSEHFFPDCKLKLNIYTNNDCDTTLVENDAEEIRNTFFKVKTQHNLYFNPNVSKEGVQGRMDPHGLVIVLSCGTLHVQKTCAGVFEQVFALARDPSCDNNWKIKNTELNLRSRNDVIGPPSLCDSELTSNLLILPPD